MSYLLLAPQIFVFINNAAIRVDIPYNSTSSGYKKKASAPKKTTRHCWASKHYTLTCLDNWCACLSGCVWVWVILCVVVWWQLLARVDDLTLRV